MADQTESNPLDDGTVDPGQEQQASAQVDVQRTSVDVAQFAALLEDETIVDLLDRRLQSIKDRRFAKQEQQMTDFQQKLERLESLQKSGMSRDQALDRMSLEDRLGSLEERLGQGSSGVTQSQSVKPPSADVQAFFSATGVDINSPQATEFLRGGDTSPQALVSFVTRVKGKPQQQPSPAQVAPPVTGQTPAPRDAEAINRELITAMETVPKDFKRIAALNKELQAANKG